LKPLRLFGLIGNPLSHSFSADYFKRKFENEKIEDCQYRLFPMQDISNLRDLLLNFPDLQGLNITIPHKISVLEYLDELDDNALVIGAVNTIKVFKNDASEIILKGYNTDAYGFKESIKPFLDKTHEKALILGRGGASMAVYHVLNDLGIVCNYAVRNPQKENEIGYDQLNEFVISNHLLIINTTPLGNYPNVDEFPPIPYQYLSSNHFLYDLTYNPAESVFLRNAKKMGSQTLNGLAMLKLQAEKSWEIWNS